MITVIVNTRNEQDNIADCIESAKLLTDEILVVDMQSTDKTKEIAITTGARVVDFPYTQYVEPARTFALKESTGDWVFILDADERMTAELAEEIKKLSVDSRQSSAEAKYQTSSDNCRPITENYFKVPRKNIFGHKKWLAHGGWWPDHQIRLIKKSAFVEWPARIHSTPEIVGGMGYLQNPILHYFHGDLTTMVNKTLNFENIESDLLFEAKKVASTPIFFRKFLGELWRRLIKNAGFMDGTYGILESIYQSYSKTITYLLLYEKSRFKKDDN